MPDWIAFATNIALAGLANSVGAFVTNPLDVVKCRLQVVYGRNAGWVRVFYSIVREEGASGLYRGLSASLLRECSYSALRLGLYAPVRDAAITRQRDAASDNRTGAPFTVKVIAGLISGCTGAAVTNPVDLVKVRLMVAHTQGRAPRGIRAEFRDVASGGVGAMWRGVGPNVQRAALLTSAQVSCYDEIKLRMKRSGLFAGETPGSEGVLLHSAAAFWAALVAATITTPVDTVKTRMMAMAGTQRSTVRMLSRIIAEEGVAAVYKGFWPTWGRLCLHTVCTFTTYEALRSAAGLQPL
jgi:hypothetical protein